MAGPATAGRNLGALDATGGRAPKSRTLGGDRWRAAKPCESCSLRAGGPGCGEVWMTEGTTRRPSSARSTRSHGRGTSPFGWCPTGDSSPSGNRVSAGVVASPRVEPVPSRSLVLAGARRILRLFVRPDGGPEPSGSRTRDGDDESDALVYVELDDDLESSKAAEAEVAGEDDENDGGAKPAMTKAEGREAGRAFARPARVSRPPTPRGPHSRDRRSRQSRRGRGKVVEPARPGNGPATRPWRRRRTRRLVGDEETEADDLDGRRRRPR